MKVKTIKGKTAEEIKTALKAVWPTDLCQL
jgi:hypothetical protein